MSTTKWAVDAEHSEVAFKVKYMMFTNISGNFRKFDATIETDGDNFENAKIGFTADVESITTGNEERDGHLLGEDFFETTKFPQITFKAGSFTKEKDNHYILEGDLTLHGVTKPVKLDVEVGGISNDPWGSTKAGFSIEGKISRKEWGLNYNSVLEAGGVLISDEVKLAIELQFTKQ